MSNRVLILGLDGATFELIKPWADAGLLLAFKKVMDQGTYGILKSSIPYYTIPAWISFATGCNPGEHGLFGFFKEGKKGYDYILNMNPSTLVKQKTLWQILSDHKKTVGVINVPGTYPPSKVNGYMVTSILTPPDSPFTYPRSFEETINQFLGKYDIFFKNGSKDAYKVIDNAYSLQDQRYRLAWYLWQKKKVDFLTVVDSGTDRVGHELFWCLDQNCKDRNYLLEYYSSVDVTLSKILSWLDDDTTLIIMSDHGMERLDRFLNLNAFLMSKGYLKVKNGITNKIKKCMFDHNITPHNIYKILRKLGLERLVIDGMNADQKFSLINKLFFSANNIDWANTTAYASGTLNGIRINIKGRQPLGCVRKRDVESFKDKLILELLTWEDSGKRVIKRIDRSEDIYHGKYVKDAPDLVCDPIKGYEFFSAHGFAFKDLIVDSFGVSGCHNSDGIFIAYGKNIEHKILDDANIIDIAPTVLNLMDVPILENMDGKVLL